MRPNHNKRMRGRHRKGPNPLTRTYESNGPDVKVRGTAQHIMEKYSQLARDALASGDPIQAENYLQHAEHYYRIIAAAQQQMPQNQQGYFRPGEQDNEETYEDDEESSQALAAGGQPPHPESRFGNGSHLNAGQPYQGNGENGQPYSQIVGESDLDRPEQRFDPRPDRFERHERSERPDRPQQRFDRQDRPHREDRFRHDRSERFDRQDRPDRPDRQERPERVERFDRQDRHDRRFDRRPRAPIAIEEEVEGSGDAAPGLPSFITAPLRQSAPTPENDSTPADADSNLSTGDPDASEEGSRYPFRNRRRRRGRPVGEEAGEASPSPREDEKAD